MTRYDYEYSAEELEPWTNRVAEIEDAAETTFAFFNNHARGSAARNAGFLSKCAERALRARRSSRGGRVHSAGRGVCSSECRHHGGRAGGW